MKINRLAWISASVHWAEVENTLRGHIFEACPQTWIKFSESNQVFSMLFLLYLYITFHGRQPNRYWMNEFPQHPCWKYNAKAVRHDKFLCKIKNVQNCRRIRCHQRKDIHKLTWRTPLSQQVDSIHNVKVQTRFASPNEMFASDKTTSEDTMLSSSCVGSKEEGGTVMHPQPPPVCPYLFQKGIISLKISSLNYKRFRTR